jgi:hypothetical protein
MPKTNYKVTHNGKTYFTVSAPAKMLLTTANKVRDLMGSGELEWTQFRVNGQLMILADSVISYRKRMIARRAKED